MPSEDVLVTGSLSLWTCSSCRSEYVNGTEVEVLEPGIVICRNCLQTGRFSGLVFFDFMYVIKGRLRQTAENLRQYRVVQGERTGWHHFFGLEKIGISSTAYAVGLLKRIDPASPGLDLAARTVLSGYVQTSEGDKGLGGWSWTSGPTAVCVEPTCYCLMQLSMAGYLNPDDAEARGAIQWLLSQQDPLTGAWGPRLGLRVNTYATALAMLTISKLRSRDEAVLNASERALDRAGRWLLAATNLDSGWGRYANDEESNPWHTAHCLQALFEGGPENTAERISRAIEYLRQDVSGWSRTLTAHYEVELEGHRHRVNFNFHPKPIVVTTLLKAGMSPHNPDIMRAVFEIVKAHDERTGTWKIPNDELGSIFEVNHNAICLSEFLERAGSIGTVLELESRVRRLEELLPDIQDVVGSQEEVNRSIRVLVEGVSGRVEAITKEVRELGLHIQEGVGAFDAFRRRVTPSEHIQFLYLMAVQAIYWIVASELLGSRISAEGKIVLSVLVGIATATAYSSLNARRGRERLVHIVLLIGLSLVGAWVVSVGEDWQSVVWPFCSGVAIAVIQHFAASNESVEASN